MTAARSYLFVTVEAGGNVPPVLGLARRLAARGHRVRVLTEPCLLRAVEAAGADFVPFTRHFTRSDRTRDLAGDWAARTPAGALRAVFANVVFGPARGVAEETRRAIEAERPGVVVADVMTPGALLAAEAAGVPRVVLFHMPEYLPGPGRPAAGPGFLPRTDAVGRVRDALMTRLFHALLGGSLTPFNDARRALGLPPLGAARELVEQYHAADLRLIQTSRAFDFPITPPPPNVRDVGPVLDDPDWAGAWQSPWPADDPRPLVVASLSSTFQDQGGVLRRIIAALGSLPVRALVTLGPAMAAERFDVPANVVTAASAPHAQVFPHAAAVVTHAGHGTVMRALAHGLPLLCLPMGRDQDDNAARVFARGAGLRLRPSATPRRIAAAIGRLLSEPGFRAQAERLGAIIRADVAEDRAVQELEAVGQPPSRAAVAGSSAAG
ncbi:MAG TPA: nucleotide disphospho-sugar-binding domain-containing protein [Longimicrobium sp.]|nr:nucleotide disphospho-sugar-binding domain-containing protein [Longimicrobium sp.]